MKNTKTPIRENHSKKISNKKSQEINIKDWETMRLIYEVGLDSIEGIAQQFNTTYYEIKKKITRENWVKASKNTADNIIIAKLFKVLIIQMHNVEKSIHHNKNNQITPAKREQDAKTLGSLVRIYEKLSHMQKETKNNTTKNNSLNILRHELEKRLKKLEKNS